MARADLEQALAELARVRSGSEPIVSVYLDARLADPQQRERVRVFVQEATRRTLSHYPEGTPGREALVRTLGRVHEWAAQLAAAGDELERPGVALFACESLGLWRAFAFRAPFRTDLATDAVPHLVQLARRARETPPVLVAAPGRDGAELYQVRSGEVEAVETVRRAFPRGDEEELEHGAGRLVAGEGPTARSERKDARHDEDRARRNRKAAAEELTARFDGGPGAVIVLVGAARTVAAFERQLPERLRARVVARVPRPRGWGSGDGVRKDAVLAAATEGARASGKDREARNVAGVVGEALRGGIAVVGPEDVVLAVNEGRVHELVLEEDFRRSGWRCDNCEALGADAESAEVCPYCGGELRAVLDLGEALVARALAVGAAVEIVPRERRLHGYRGVGAFLRQTAPTGLRGASAPSPAAPGATPP
jgi:hypothetical protein